MLTTLLSKKFILLYLVLFILFRFAFECVNKYYIKNATVTPHPIDVHPFAIRKYADTGYLILAKEKGYDHGKYFRSFLPLDLIYPFVYSLLFLSCLLYCNNPLLSRILTILVFSGAILDWSEDISFSIFLSSAGNGLAGMVAFFSSAKTVVFIINLLSCIVWLGAAAISLFRK